EPASSSEAKRQIDRLGSPIRAFIEDCCTYDPEATVAKDDLFIAMKEWVAQEEVPWNGSKDLFSRELFSAASGRVRATKPRIAGRRVQGYAGIRLAEAEEVQDDLPF
ncbi:MAG: NTP-binding protein, partial [Planctomycetota bacterium]